MCALPVTNPFCQYCFITTSAYTKNKSPLYIERVTMSNHPSLDELQGSRTQQGIPVEAFEKGYASAGVTYSYEFALFASITFELYQRLGRKITVLEVGVGTGRLGVFLALLPWVESYLGVEVEEDAFLLCKARHSWLPVELVNFRVFPVERTFDAVFLPYTILQGVEARFQQVNFLKALRQSNYLTLVDVMLPDVF